jgi:hypothetical protein
MKTIKGHTAFQGESPEVKVKRAKCVRLPYLYKDLEEELKLPREIQLCLEPAVAEVQLNEITMFLCPKHLSGHTEYIESRGHRCTNFRFTKEGQGFE